MKKIKIFQIDAFTDKPFGGNPAGVTFNEGLSKEEMQSIAREMNLAETAFISKTDKADYNLRWFTPAVEVDLCGHATIASLHFLRENGLLNDNSQIRFETRSGILNCGISDNKPAFPFIDSFGTGRYYMQIPLFNSIEYSNNQQEIIDALGIDPKDIDRKIPFILLENGYLYIYIKSLDALKDLSPDFKELLKINRSIKEVESFVVFTLECFDKEDFAHSRFFAPFYGIDEDPVTGSANGPLMLVLKKLGFVKEEKKETILTFEQGDIINRRGRVTVKHNSVENELYIMGNAVTVMKGELFFPQSGQF
jgi:PhzF family phenazine biosynthesis protein